MRFLPVFLLGCVGESVPLDYAQRAYPECSEHHVVHHRTDEISLSEVEMTCEGLQRVVTIKCQFGWGIMADTTCWVNN